jgi:hypothetical protein
MVFALRDTFSMTFNFLHTIGRAKTTPWLLASRDHNYLKNHILLAGLLSHR